MTTFDEVKEQERAVRLLELRCMERELLKKLQEDYSIDERVVEEYRAEIDRMINTIRDLKSDSAFGRSQNVIVDLGDKLEREKQTSEQLRIRLRNVHMLEDKKLQRSIDDLNRVIECLEHELCVQKADSDVLKKVIDVVTRWNDNKIDKRPALNQIAYVVGANRDASKSLADDKQRLVVGAAWLELP